MATILNSAMLDSTLPSWIQPFCTKLWLKLVQSDSKSFICTQLDDGSHLEFCHHGFSHFAQKKLHSFILTQLDDGSHLQFGHLGFSHLSFSSQTHSHLPRLVPTIFNKKTSLIHSESSWWLQPSWYSFILRIQPFCTKNKLHSFILTQLDDGSHHEFCNVGFKHCHPGFIHLVIFSQIHSKTLFLHSDSDSN